MANQKDQGSDPLEENQMDLASMAEKSLPGFRKESKPEIESESSSSDSSVDEEDIIEDQFAEEFIRQQKLNELKRRAFYSLLLAFRVETLSLGNKRDKIVEKLMNEWSIAQETRVSFEYNIQKNLVAHQQRVDLEAKETKKMVESKPVIAKKLNFDGTTRSSWGRVYPEALVGRTVLVRMPDEDEFQVLVIKEFNAKHGMHRLATVDPNVMWNNETLSWIDIRKVPGEDIRWRIGEDPNFETLTGFGAGK